MAITEADYLHVHQGESTYLLLRGSTHFHLVRVDAGLTEPVMKRLLRMYPCGDNRLRELGVTFSAFKGENLRGRGQGLQNRRRTGAVGGLGCPEICAGK